MIKHRDSKKFIEWNLLRMDQPSKSQGPEESGQEVSCGSQHGPQRIDLYQKGRKISQGDLGKQDEKDDAGNKQRDEESFQTNTPIHD